MSWWQSAGCCSLELGENCRLQRAGGRRVSEGECQKGQLYTLVIRTGFTDCTMEGWAAMEGDCTSGMCPERAPWDSSDSFREWEPRNEGRTISRSVCLEDCERSSARAEQDMGSSCLGAGSEAF